MLRSTRPARALHISQGGLVRRQLGLELPGLARRHGALEQGDGLVKVSLTHPQIACTQQGERDAERLIDGFRDPDAFVPDGERLAELTTLGGRQANQV